MALSKITKAEAAKQFDNLSKTLAASFPLLMNMSRSNKLFFDLGMRGGKECALMLEIDGTYLGVNVAFEQRAGVWHDLGNFPNDECYRPVLDSLGLARRSSARSDLDGLGAVVNHVLTIIDKA